MKKLSVNYQACTGNLSTVLLSVIAIMFLLQGCCFGPEDIAKTPCRCSDKPAYATKNKSQVTIVAETVSGKPANDPKQDKTLQPDPSLLHTSPIFTTKAKTEQALSPAEANVSMRTAKSLPLGIKGIRSHLIAGPNMSFKSSKEDYGNIDHKHKPGVGFEMGFGSTLSFSDKFAVSTGLVFKKNNASEVLSYSSTGEPGTGGSTTEYESKYSYSFISVPLVAEYKLTDQLTAIAGPEINFLTGATVKSSGYGDTEKTDIKDNSVKTGISIQAGIRYTIPKSPIAIQVVYDHRLSRLNEKSDYYIPGGSSGDTPPWRMSGFSLGLIFDACSFLEFLVPNKK
jgi:hypothetical protein